MTPTPIPDPALRDATARVALVELATDVQAAFARARDRVRQRNDDYQPRLDA